MKLTLFFSLFFCLQVFGSTEAQNISLDVRAASVKSVLRTIQKQTGFSYVIPEYLLDKSNPITIQIKDKPLDRSLALLFVNQPFQYTIRNKVIVFKEKKSVAASSSPIKEYKSQQTKLNGQVVDEDGNPLSGVSITIKGDTRAVVTDLKGNFSIDVKQTDQIVITFIGMETQTIAVQDQKTIRIVMKALPDELDEVTVIGYGQQKKESIVSSLSTVGPKELTIKQRNLRNILAGQLPGIIAVQRSGEPGNDAAAFFIRGQSSYAGGTSPLVLVDGVPRRMDDIDVEEIETFTVLKDAAATSVYGAEGANGVVLITSKRGKVQKTIANFTAQTSVMTPQRLMKLMDSYTYLSLFNEAQWNDQGNPNKDVFRPQFTQEQLEKYRTGEDPDLYPSVNWIDLLRSNTQSSRYTVNFRGGSDKVRFFTSGAYFKENGIFQSNAMENYNSNIGLDRFNLRSNIDMQLTNSTQLSVDMSGQYLRKNQPGFTSDNIFELISRFPVHIIPMVYSDGSASDHGAVGAAVVNQPYNMLNNSGYRKTWSGYLQSKVALRQDLKFITEGLFANGVVSFDADFTSILRRSKTPNTFIALGRNTDGTLNKRTIKPGAALGNPFQTGDDAEGSKNIYMEGSLNYKHVFAERHDVSGLILYMQKESQSQRDNNGMKLLPFRKQSIVARVTYGYDNRYLVEASMGATGSDNFASGNRWGAFPAAGVAWYMSNEKFMAGLQKYVSKLKLRGSYGVTGNDRIGRDDTRFPYRGSINEGAPGYDLGLAPGFGGSASNGRGSGIVEGTFPALGISWEIEKKLNAGIDIGLFNGRVDLTVDYFKNRRSDILLQRRTVLNATGFRSFPFQNFGVVDNKGVDASLILKQKAGNVNISARGNLTYARNKIVEYDEIPQKYPYMSYTGNPIDKPYIYIAEGLYTPNDFDITTAQNGAKTYKLKAGMPTSTSYVAPGDIKYKDLNGDGLINDYDRTYDHKFYSPVPEIVYGFGVNADWKGLSIGVFFQGTANSSANMLSNSFNLIPFSSGVGNSSGRVEILDRWRADDPENQNVFMPRIHSGGYDYNTLGSTWWYRSAGFLRLKNVEVGYDFNKDLIKRLKMRNLRLYLQGTNVALWDKMKLWDPELGSANSGAKYPLSSTYSLGLEITF
ncbi:SusC/RagA family TonB-linked outer membrane protein [Sphingobacterium spiritivorum]|uniref:SusC/RagA family TonB-linked outer membrane protein n=1 Tax=Sphingobacterium spiritivorum TaxID=258 RepID=UPI003DA1E56E